MADEAWRTRLEAAVEKDGRALREISIGAGLSHGYLHGILRDNKEPTLDRFIKVCDEIDVSLSYILLGANISKDTEQIVSALEGDESTRMAVLALLGRRVSA